MIEAMRHDLAIPYVVDWQVFKNWDKYLNQIYKANVTSVKKWQSSTDIRLTKMSFKGSNVEDAKLRMPKWTRRNVLGSVA
jgi:hypothetical protein